MRSWGLTRKWESTGAYLRIGGIGERAIVAVVISILLRCRSKGSGHIIASAREYRWAGMSCQRKYCCCGNPSVTSVSVGKGFSVVFSRSSSLLTAQLYSR